MKLFGCLFAVITLATTLMSCSDNDDKTIPSSELPEAAKTFVSTYYPDVQIILAQKEKHEYDITLGNGHTIEFDLSGEWKDVDAPLGQTIPSGFYPAAIDNYISQNAPEFGINEISRIAEGYEVELTDGQEIIFNSEGEFVRFDK